MAIWLGCDGERQGRTPAFLAIQGAIRKTLRSVFKSFLHAACVRFPMTGIDVSRLQSICKVCPNTSALSSLSFNSVRIWYWACSPSDVVGSCYWKRLRSTDHLIVKYLHFPIMSFQFDICSHNVIIDRFLCFGFHDLLAFEGFYYRNVFSSEKAEASVKTTRLACQILDFPETQYWRLQRTVEKRCSSGLDGESNLQKGCQVSLEEIREFGGRV